MRDGQPVTPTRAGAGSSIPLKAPRHVAAARRRRARLPDARLRVGRPDRAPPAAAGLLDALPRAGLGSRPARAVGRRRLGAALTPADPAAVTPRPARPPGRRTCPRRLGLALGAGGGGGQPRTSRPTRCSASSPRGWPASAPKRPASASGSPASTPAVADRRRPDLARGGRLGAAFAGRPAPVRRHAPRPRLGIAPAAGLAVEPVGRALLITDPR